VSGQLAPQECRSSQDPGTHQRQSTRLRHGGWNVLKERVAESAALLPFFIIVTSSYLYLREEIAQRES
jgi:hypothetical protein